MLDAFSFERRTGDHCNLNHYLSFFIFPAPFAVVIRKAPKKFNCFFFLVLCNFAL